ALHVHEHEVVAVGVQVLHRALVDGRGVDLGAGVEGPVDHLAGQHVLERGAHERPALSGLDVLELDHGPQLAVEVENQAVLEVVRGRHCVRRTLFWKRSGGPEKCTSGPGWPARREPPRVALLRNFTYRQASIPAWDVPPSCDAHRL